MSAGCSLVWQRLLRINAASAWNAVRDSCEKLPCCYGRPVNGGIASIFRCNRQGVPACKVTWPLSADEAISRRYTRGQAGADSTIASLVDYQELEGGIPLDPRETLHPRARGTGSSEASNRALRWSGLDCHCLCCYRLRFTGSTHGRSLVSVQKGTPTSAGGTL